MNMNKCDCRIRLNHNNTVSNNYLAEYKGVDPDNQSL